MAQLMSKEILYDPLKELDEKASLGKEHILRYEKLIA